LWYVDHGLCGSWMVLLLKGTLIVV
jgi:hypothetical protein